MFDLGLRTMAAHRRTLAAAASVVAVAACFSDSPITVNGEILCDVDQGLLFSSLPPNAIPALTLPTMVDAGSPETDYLSNFDRVLGVVVDGEARAYPHRALWRHEIINDSIGDEWVSVTLCPLTGSGLAFDPHIGGQRLDLGVSGLLFANNLVLYDRLTEGVYGPQLQVAAACSGFTGQELALVPVQEMSWSRWKGLHPDTKVVSGASPGLINRGYPYGSYDNISNTDLLFPMPVDRSRPIKERVLAIRLGDDGGRGYPFVELADIGDVVALNEIVGGVPTAVFFEVREGWAALAFDARINGQTLTFDADPTGFWIDRETNSTWTFDGTAIAGPLAGEVLRTRSDAYTLFWFAWRHFQPDGTTFLN